MLEIYKCQSHCLSIAQCYNYLMMGRNLSKLKKLFLQFYDLFDIETGYQFQHYSLLTHMIIQLQNYSDFLKLLL